MFNTDKCRVMHFGHNNPKAVYHMDGMQLMDVLGVIVSQDLKWEKQYRAVVRTANRVLGMIKRNFVDTSKDTILALYKSLVRPHLEYCCPVWAPHYNLSLIHISEPTRPY